MSAPKSRLRLVPPPAAVGQPPEGLGRAFRAFGGAWRAGQPNHCPGCDRQHWLVGRILAECAFCGTALPIARGGAGGAAEWVQP